MDNIREELGKFNEIEEKLLLERQKKLDNLQYLARLNNLIDDFLDIQQ